MTKKIHLTQPYRQIDAVEITLQAAEGTAWQLLVATLTLMVCSTHGKPAQGCWGCVPYTQVTLYISGGFKF